MEVQVGKGQAQGVKDDSARGIQISVMVLLERYYWSCGAPQSALITGVPVVTSHAA